MSLFAYVFAVDVIAVGVIVVVVVSLFADVAAATVSFDLYSPFCCWSMVMKRCK